MKTYMMRKAASIDEWKSRKATLESIYGESAEKEEVVIEKTVTLKPAEFKEFTENLLEDSELISSNRSTMYVDENRIWHCMEVKTRGGKFSVLVMADGYNYPRYTAMKEAR